jgi:hypothetical protein
MRLSRILGMCCCLCVGVAALAPAQFALAQAAPMADPAAKKPLSPPAKAEVSVGAANISIDYSAPSIRQRVIFGGLVPYGQVWRTGANAATTLKTSANLKIGDLMVPAGTYTLYSLPTADGMQLIVNKQTGQWGTVYDAKQDLGRVPMKVTETSAPLETMVIDFENTMGDMGMTELHVRWADRDASVEINVAK